MCVLRTGLPNDAGVPNPTPNWFTRHLAIVEEETKDWPDWAKEQAAITHGKPATEPPADPPRATDSPPLLRREVQSLIEQGDADFALTWGALAAAEPGPLRPLPHCRTQEEIDARFAARWLVVPAEESENDGTRRSGMWSSKGTEEDNR